MTRSLKRALTKSINYNMRLRQFGRTMLIPVLAGTGRANRETNEEHLLLLLKALNDHLGPRLLIDVGTNVGQTLIKHYFASGPECRYFGFEPNVTCARYIELLISTNGLTNAKVIPVALGGSKRLEKLLLASPEATDPAASINDKFRDATAYGAAKYIAVIDGDTAISTIGITDRNFLLKVDVEGAESEVVDGMTKTLRELRPIVIMEILPPSNYSSEVNEYRLRQAVDIRRKMRDLGYDELHITETGRLSRDSGMNEHLFIPSELTPEVFRKLS